MGNWPAYAYRASPGLSERGATRDMRLRLLRLRDAQRRWLWRAGAVEERRGAGAVGRYAPSLRPQMRITIVRAPGQQRRDVEPGWQSGVRDDAAAEYGGWAGRGGSGSQAGLAEWGRRTEEEEEASLSASCLYNDASEAARYAQERGERRQEQEIKSEDRKGKGRQASVAEDFGSESEAGCRYGCSCFAVPGAAQQQEQYGSEPDPGRTHGASVEDGSETSEALGGLEIRGGKGDGNAKNGNKGYCVSPGMERDDGAGVPEHRWLRPICSPGSSRIQTRIYVLPDGRLALEKRAGGGGEEEAG